MNRSTDSLPKVGRTSDRRTGRKLFGKFMIKQQKESLVTVQRTISCRSSWLYFWSHTGNGSGGVRGFTEGPHVPLPGPTAFFYRGLLG
jgi:hypothetical protein